MESGLSSGSKAHHTKNPLKLYEKYTTSKSSNTKDRNVFELGKDFNTTKFDYFKTEMSLN